MDKSYQAFIAEASHRADSASMVWQNASSKGASPEGRPPGQSLVCPQKLEVPEMPKLVNCHAARRSVLEEYAVWQGAI
jgi:hypothetical protein